MHDTIPSNVAVTRRVAYGFSFSTKTDCTYITFTSTKEFMISSLLFVCLFVFLLATLRKNFRTDLHEIFRECWQWANEQTFKFWWRSRTDSPDGGTDIATLVRRALAEVCTVPVLLVSRVLTVPVWWTLS